MVRISLTRPLGSDSLPLLEGYAEPQILGFSITWTCPMGPDLDTSFVQQCLVLLIDFISAEDR